MKCPFRLYFSLTLLASCFFIEGANAQSFVDTNANWRFFDQGEVQDLAWKNANFDDAAWPQAAAPLGYGEEGVSLVGCGPDAENKFNTTYFRHHFNIASLDTVNGLSGELIRDDGAVVYLNGIEVFRSNMPATAIVYDTPSAAVTGGVNETTAFPFTIDRTLLVEGDNVLAVEVHQFQVTSSDLRFSLELHNDDLAIIRGPYLQQVSDTQAIVKWRTNGPSIGQVMLGTSENALTLPATEDELKLNHSVLVTGLSPSTPYFYSIGTPEGALAGDASHKFRTSPTTGTRTHFRTWVVGDSGTGDDKAEAVRDAFNAYNGDDEVHLFMMLGDNAYGSGTDAEYQRGVFDMFPERLKQTPLWSTLGNHDGYSANSNTLSGPYYDIFALPKGGEVGGAPSGTESYYSFDYANVHFICLNSYDANRSTAAPMYQWLQADLLANDQEWTVAFWHHPPYTKGSHNSDTETNLIQMRENFLPLLEDNGVDLVLSGHSHVYERSMLIDGHYGPSTTFQPSMAVDSRDGNPNSDGPYQKENAPHNGAVYAVVGSSAKLRGGTMDHPVMINSTLQYASMILDIDSDQLSAIALSRDGIEIDRFTIDKGNHAPLVVSDIVATGTPASEEGATFSFGAQTLGGVRPFSYLWTLGDGTSSTAIAPTHIYNESGSYSITVTVTDDEGSEVSLSTTLDVANAAPFISGPFQIVGEEGEALTLSASATDVGNDVLTYRWTFDDGSTATGQTIQHTFNDETTAPITLRVTDEDGAFSEQLIAVVISNVVPRLTIQIPPTAERGASLLMSANAEDPGDDDVVITWEFGDGATATGATVNHVYEDVGTYRVIIRADDQDGGTAIRQAFVDVVEGEVQSAELNIPGGGDEGESLSFEIIGAQNPVWDMGDGRLRNGSSFRYTYEDNGTYRVQVTYQIAGETRTAMRDVIVQNLAPMILSPTLVSGNEGSVISMSAVVSDVPADELTTQWTLPSGEVLNGQFVSTVFNDQLSQSLTLTVTDDDGGQDVKTIPLTILNLPPQVTLSVPSTASTNALLVFEATATDPGDDVVLLTWDFGDGSTGNGTPIQHAYSAPGTYEVTFSANDQDGGVVTRRVNVVVSDDAQEAEINVPGTVDEGRPLVVSISGAESARWDFGDGTVSAQGNNLSHTYADDGTYAVLVTYSVDGALVSDTRIVDVQNLAPQITGPTSVVGDEGELLRLQARATDVAADTLSYSWVFPDGTLRNGAAIEHRFADQSTESILLRVEDDEGGLSTANVSLNIRNVPPSLSLIGPANLVTGSEGLFDAQATDPGNDALTYLWDFGDGNTATQNPVRHTFSEEGSFRVSVIVDDGDGASVNAELAVLVSEENVGEAQVSVPSSLREGDLASFSIVGASNEQWSFGDGAQSSGANVSHRYEDNGQFTVTVSYAFEGQSRLDSRVVRVDNVPPQITDLPDAIVGSEGESFTLRAQASDVPADTLLYQWRLADGRLFEGTQVTIPFGDNSDDPIELRVSDDDGGIDTALIPVNIVNAPPTLTLNVPSRSRRLESIVLSAQSDDPGGDAVAVTWDFGDGQSASGPVVQHRYLREGVFRITARATDDDGASVSQSVNITVSQSDSPFADIVVPPSGQEGEVLSFEIFGASNIVWNFGDGQSASGAQVSHTYEDDGAYTLEIDYTLEGNRRRDLRLIVVRNLLPVIAPVASVLSVEGTQAVFSASARDVPADPLRYSWSFPDGSRIFGAVARRTLDDDFDNVVRLSVSDGDGGEAFANVPVRIENVAPTISMQARGQNGGPVRALTLSTFSVEIEDPGADSFEVQWDFGDGSSAQGTRVEHRFNDEGALAVSVRVTDDDGGVANASMEVNVAEAPANVPRAEIPIRGDEGRDFEVLAHNVQSPRWDFGDGSPLVRGQNVVHSYADEGVYRVTLSGIAQQATFSQSRTVTIANVAPAFTALPGPRAVQDELYIYTPNVVDVVEDPLTYSFSSDAASAQWTGERVEFLPDASDAQAGTRSFTLTVSDDEGGTTVFEFEVEVEAIESGCSQGSALPWFLALALFALPLRCRSRALR